MGVMNLMKEFIIKTKNDLIAIVIILASVTILLAMLYRWDSYDQYIPIGYGGGDTMSSIINSRLLNEQLWFAQRPRMGAPDGTDTYDIPASLLHNADLVVLKFCNIITADPMFAYNLSIYFMHYIAAIIAFFVFKELGIMRWLATCVSIVFGFMPYIAMRIAHYQLIAIYFVPLTVLLCIWLFERQDVLRPGKGFFKNKRNIWSLVFIVLIANNGIAYYPFFSCYLLGVVAIIKLLQTKKIKSMIPSIVAIMGICFCIILEMVPMFIYHMQNGRNAVAVVREGFIGAEMYEMKLMQLFMPSNSKLASVFSERIEQYNNLTPTVTENTTSYLGIFAIVGMLALIIYFFVRKTDAITKRIHFLSVLLLFMLFLVAGNGIGVAFTLFVSDSIRGYCRGVVFIFFIILLGFAHIIQELCSGNREKMIKGFTIALAVVSLWESIPFSNEALLSDTEVYYSDRDFIQTIEANVEAGSMIYQLPYLPYPEGGLIRELEDYDLSIGVALSDTLKWSFGSIKGRKTDCLLKELSELDIDVQISRVKELGFAAIYIDRRAYTKEEYEKLEREIEYVVGSKKFISRDEKLVCFIF